MGWDFHFPKSQPPHCGRFRSSQLGDVDPMPLNGRGPPLLVSRPSFFVAIAVSSQGYASQ
jgi:hypothetical protein